jgi:hypothetical protein
LNGKIPKGQSAGGYCTEFSGGRLTGPLLKMADLGFLLFLLALILAFFFRRTAATIAIAAALLCLPFYLFFLVPGPYLWIFKANTPTHSTDHFIGTTGRLLEYLVYCLLLF